MKQAFILVTYVFFCFSFLVSCQDFHANDLISKRVFASVFANTTCDKMLCVGENEECAFSFGQTIAKNRT